MKESTSGRGEGIIRAGEREVRIQFNNRALAEAEQQMKRSVIGVAQGFAQGDTGITEVAHLLRAGMQAARRGRGGKPATLIEAYLVLDEAGFSAVAEVVMTALAEVLGYDPNAAEDEEADPND